MVEGKTVEKKRKPKFKRTDFSKYSKLGVRRKKKQVYRKAKGIDNKVKLKMKGHLRKVMIGFKNNNKTRHLIDGLKPVMVSNVSDLSKIGKEEIGIVAKVGMKRKIEIAEQAVKDNVKLHNLNAKKFLIEVESKKKDKEEKKAKKEKKVKDKEKAVKDAEKKEKDKEEKKDSKDDKKGIEDKVEGEKETKEKPKTEKKAKETKDDVQTNNYGRGK
jgi:large subunit ribosomal protein L32e